MGLSSKLSCKAQSFSHCHNPHRFFQSEVLRLYFPHWNPGLRSLSHSPVFPPRLSARIYGIAQFASCHLAASPLLPSCPSLPLLPVWMNVSPLTAWLLDFPTVRFSGSSGCFFVFKFVVVLILVVRGGTVCLPMPPSWPAVPYMNFFRAVRRRVKVFFQSLLFVNNRLKVLFWSGKNFWSLSFLSVFFLVENCTQRNFQLKLLQVWASLEGLLCLQLCGLLPSSFTGC